MKRIIILFVIIYISFPIAAREKLHLKIGTYENSPKIFTDETGEVSGFWADITNYIAKKEDWEIELIHGDWNQCMERLETGEIDMMVDVASTPARQKKFSFNTDTVLLSWSLLYTYKGIHIDSILDLEGKKIAGLKGSVVIEGSEGLKDIINKFELKCEIVELNSYNEVFKALQNREVFASVTNKDFGHKHEKEYSVQRTPIIFQPAYIQFAFNKNSELTPGLIKIIDSDLIQLKGDNRSIYYTSMERHLGGVEKIDFFPLWVKVLIIFILGLALTFFILSRFLKYQVNQKTMLLQQDITKRKEVEEALKESEIKFRTLVEQLPSVTYTAALDEASTLLYISPQIEKLLGITLDKYKSTPDFLLKHLHDEDRERVHEALNITYKSSQPFISEYRMISSDNRIVWIRDEAVIIKDDAGDPQYLQGVIFDITERKQNEKELTKYRDHLEESRQSLTFLLEDVNEVRLELEEKNKELEQFNKIFVNREFRIKELRDRVRELEQ